MAHDSAQYRLVTAAGQVVAESVAVADTLMGRTAGLMFRHGLAAGHGLAIRPCSSIHMFFMRFEIDVAFVDRNGAVLHICHSIKPWRMSRMVRRAKAAIELEGGALQRAGVRVGDVLTMTRIDATDPPG